jgi:hypothetical protein
MFATFYFYKQKKYQNKEKIEDNIELIDKV